MAAAVYDLVLEQGVDFLLGLVFKDAKGKPIDLTGITAAAQVRKNIEDTAALADFTIIFDTNRSTGKVTLFIPASTTTALVFDTGEWDLKFTYNTGAKKRIMRGKVTLSRAVTR